MFASFGRFAGDLYGLAGGRVDFGVEHRRGDCHGAGQVVLYLARGAAEAFEPHAGVLGILGSGAGESGDNVGYDIELAMGIAGGFLEFFYEAFELGGRGLAHFSQHVVGAVLGSGGELSADEALGEHLHESGTGLGVGLNEVVANTGRDESVLDAGGFEDAVPKVDEPGVRGVEVVADIGEQARGAFAVGAGLGVFPGHAVHVGCRAADIADSTFEVGIGGELFDFLKYGLDRAGCDVFALMHGEGAEGAAAEAASVAGDGELDGIERGDGLAIGGVGLALVGPGVDAVEFFGAYRFGGVLDDPAVGVALGDGRRAAFGGGGE